MGNESLWGLVVLFVVMGLAVLLLMVSVFQAQRNPRLKVGFMAAGLFGVLLGWGAFYGGVQITGQQMQFAVAGFEDGAIDIEDSEPPGDAQRGEGGGMMGGGPGMGGMGGMMGGGPGMGGMMGGGPGMGGGGRRRGGSSRRSLTSLVRKLELLTAGVSVKLNDEQVKAIGAVLVAVGGEEKMSDEVAKETLETIQEVLDEEQQASLDKVGLPRRRGGGGGFGGFGGMMGGNGNRQPQDDNSFAEADNAKALITLLERHGVKPPQIDVKKPQERPSRPPTSPAATTEDNSDGGVIETVLKQHDKDGDGALSRSEAPEFLKNRFDRIDTNKDGKCDLKEMTAARRFTPGG